jgi:hypothetical protein
MPSRASLLLFVAATTGAMVILWMLADVTWAQGAVFVAGILIGGAMYWTSRARS